MVEEKLNLKRSDVLYLSETNMGNVGGLPPKQPWSIPWDKKKKSVASVNIVAMVMLNVDGSSKHNDSHSGR